MREAELGSGPCGTIGYQSRAGVSPAVLEGDWLHLDQHPHTGGLSIRRLSASAWPQAHTGIIAPSQSLLPLSLDSTAPRASECRA